MRTPQKTRRYPRLPIAFPVFVHANYHDGSSFLEFATVLNVSAGGALLALRKVPRSRRVSLEIPVAPAIAADMPKTQRQIKASVVRSEPKDNMVLLGLQFDRPLVARA